MNDLPEIESNIEVGACGHTLQEHAMQAAERASGIATMFGKTRPDGSVDPIYGVIGIVDLIGGGGLNTLGISLSIHTILAAYEDEYGTKVEEVTEPREVWAFAADLVVKAAGIEQRLMEGRLGGS